MFKIREAALLAVLISTAVGVSGQPAPTPQPAAALLEKARQLVLVVTDGWNAPEGTLTRFVRSGPSAQWTRVGTPVRVVVGREGLGWTPSIGGEPGAVPAKKEGDDKAPAGVFRLVTAFGRTAHPLPGTHLAYRYLADNVECVDDVSSRYYNQLTTRQQAERVDWNSSEKMWREREYQLGIVVEHNTQPAEPGGGSCIFLHIWSEPGKATSGCTAMDEHDLTALVRWLDPALRPVLVQLPRAEHERLRSTWKLP